MEVVLLLTACIKPNVTDKIAVSDWKKRELMYMDALNWYLDNTDYNIVFVENSGVDISNNFKNYKNRLEIHTYESLPMNPDRSRSYREMEIMEYAFEHSCFLKQKDILVIKITGRLKLLNIKKIVKFLIHKKFEFVCSAKNARKPFSDCRFIYFTKSFWPILRQQKENIWPTYGMEWVLGDAIRMAKKNGLKFIYPPYLERIEGIGMSTGGALNLNGLHLLKAELKHLILRILFGISVLPRDGKDNN